MASKKNKSFKTGILLIIGVLVLFGVIFLSTNSGYDGKQLSDSKKNLNLTQDNFVLLDKGSYMSAKAYCNPNSPIYFASDEDSYDFTYRIINTPLYSALRCNIYVDGQNYGSRLFGTAILEIGVKLDYQSSHSITFCCEVEDSQLGSNEICLPEIYVAKVC